MLFQIFVALVVILTTSVVVIFYICLLPHKAAEGHFWTVYHLIVGHWLLANIVFHYFKAAFTDPGCPPQVCTQYCIGVGLGNLLGRVISMINLIESWTSSLLETVNHSSCLVFVCPYIVWNSKKNSIIEMPLRPISFTYFQCKIQAMFKKIVVIGPFAREILHFKIPI